MTRSSLLEPLSRKLNGLSSKALLVPSNPGAWLLARACLLTREQLNIALNNTRQGYVRKDTLKLAGFLFVGRPA